MSALSDLTDSASGIKKPLFDPLLGGLDALRQASEVSSNVETESVKEETPPEPVTPVEPPEPLEPLVSLIESPPVASEQTIAEINDETAMSVVPDVPLVNVEHEETLTKLRKDQVQHDDKRSFIERQELRLGVGNVRMTANDALKSLEVFAQKKAAWESNEFTNYPLELPFNVHIPGFMQQLEFEQQTPERQEELRAAALTSLNEKRVTANQDFLNAVAVLGDEELAPTHPVMRALQLAQEADDQELVNKIILEFPLITLGETALPSLAQGGFKQVLLPASGAIAVKLLGGATAVARAAYVAGGGIVSGQMEFNAAMFEFFQEKGYDMSDISAVNAALDDREIVKEAKAFAKKRAIPIAIIDMLSMYLATKQFIPPIFKAKVVRHIANGVTQFTQQTSLGALGELSAQINAGQEINWLDIKLEAIGEMQSVPGDIAMFTIANKFGIKPEKMSTLRGAIETVLANAEITEAEAIALLQEVADKGMSFDEAEALLGEFALPHLTLLNRHNEKTTLSFVPGAPERDSLDQGTFTDVKGNTLTGAEITIAETNGTVYWADSGSLRNDNSLVKQEARYDQDIEFTKLELDIAKSQGETATTINRLEDRLQGLLDSKERIALTQKTLEEAKPAMLAVLQELVANFMPGRNLILVERNPIFDALNENVLGFAGTISEETSATTTQTTAVIYLNAEILAKTYESSVNTIEEPGTPKLSDWLATLSHEFGHTLLRHYTDTLPQAVEEALLAEHRAWLAEVFSDPNVTLETILGSKENPSIHMDNVAQGNKRMKRESQKSRNTYNLSFNEWIADGISRMLSNKKSELSPAMRKHLPRLAAAMEKLYDTVKSRFKSDTTLEVFLQYLKARASRESLISFKATLSQHELNMTLGAQTNSILALLDKKELDISDDLKKELNNSMDKYNWITKWGYTLLQLAKDNPHIAGLQNYIKAIHGYWITKSSWNDQAMQTMNAWRALGGKANDLGRLLLELTIESDRLKRKLKPEEITKLMQEKGIDFGEQYAEVFAVYDRIMGDLQNALNEIESIEVTRINKDYADAPTNRVKKLAELKETFDQIRDRNYFPLTRFGKYAITVRAHKGTVLNKKPYKKGEVAHFELYETVKQRDKALGTLRREFGKGFTYEPSILEDELQSFTGLPMAIFRSLKDNPRLGLTPEQKVKVQEMIDTMSPANNIAKRMLRRKGVKGFNLNAQRGYAMYMMNLSSHIAKMRHAGQMDAAIEEVRQSSKYLSAKGIVNDKRHGILEHIKKHKDYIFSTTNEWSGLRAFGFHWYLGFNVKSALVNLTQVALVAFPYFAARKSLLPKVMGVSDAIVVKEITLAMKDVMGIYLGHDSLPINITEGISVLQAEGIIDESLATEIAGQAHGEVLSKILPAETLVGDVTKRVVNQVLEFSPMLFQAAEKINRRIVAVVAMRLAEKIKPGDQTFAIDEAREALRSTQFEYARWNRAAFMRGKASVLFLFMQYMQNVLFFMIKDPGKWRFLFMLFLAAGLQGLPGAEDLLDIFDFAAQRIKKLTGWKNPRVNARQTLREWIIKMGGDPDLIMHGLGSQSMGFGTRQFSEWSGVNIPNVSMDGSLNMGRIIPGTNYVFKGGERSGHQVVSAASDVVGAAYSIPINFFLWARDQDPNTIREFERILPSAVSNIVKAYRWANDGGIYDRSGEQIVEFNPSNPQHIMELGAKVLGFQPSRVQFAYESRYAKKEAAAFYSTSRQILLGAFFYAMDTGDKDAIAATKQAMRDWNKRVDGPQKVTHWGSLYAQHKIGNIKGAKGLPDRIFDTPLFRDIDPLFPNARFERLSEAKALKSIDPLTLDEPLK